MFGWMDGRMHVCMGGWMPACIHLLIGGYFIYCNRQEYEKGKTNAAFKLKRF